MNSDHLKERISYYFYDDAVTARYGDLQERLRALVPKESEGRTPHRFIVDVDLLRQDHQVVATELVERPLAGAMAAFDEALQNLFVGAAPVEVHNLNTLPMCGYVGDFGHHAVTPRGLTSEMLSHMVSVSGIVTKVYRRQMRVDNTVHYDADGVFQSERQYRDTLTSVNANEVIQERALPNFMAMNGDKPLTTETALSTYRDIQFITLQEPPERAPPGQISRTVEVVLTTDLVDKVKAGDRCEVFGVYKAIANAQSVTSNAPVRTMVLANNVVLKTVEELGAADDVANEDVYRVFAAEHGNERAQNALIDVLSDSLSTTIFGHQTIKRAILLQLAEGVPVNVKGGVSVRGTINVLLCGDPSTAKSQMLRVASRLSPIAINTTGRGSSGAGLTAAVVSDRDSRETGLEAGALVLADRGLCCIDELDKMSDADRTALHEAMEQSSVTITKANINATLNARTSVLAAANPVYGIWDPSKPVAANLNMQDSLLSRFDLIFLVLDHVDDASDRRMAHHILGMHRHPEADRPSMGASALSSSYYTKNVIEVDRGSAADRAVDGGNEVSIEVEGKKTRVYQRYEDASHREIFISRHAADAVGDPKRQDTLLVTQQFLSSYISYCKRTKKPKLSTEALDYVTQAYPALRRHAGVQTVMPITARCLEAMIRLGEAHAKLHLRDEVIRSDVEAADELLKECIFATGRRNEVIELQRAPRSPGNAGAARPPVVEEPVSESPAIESAEEQAAEEATAAEPEEGVPKDLVHRLRSVFSHEFVSGENEVAFDEFLVRANRSLREQGQPELTEEEARLAFTDETIQENGCLESDVVYFV